MNENNVVDIYDSTLRDGAQAVGITFSRTGKLNFAHKLDELGVSFIEGGYAGSNESDMQFFKDIAKETLATTKIVAFGSTRRAGIKAAADPFTNAFLAAETEICCLYGKTWMLHVTDVLKTTAEENYDMICDTISFLREHGRRVFFDAEHFFDGFKDNSEFAMKMLQAAAASGAENISLCDTNGGSLPNEIFEITAKVRAAFPNLQIGIHAHNDSGMAVANSIEAVRAGARLVQGCINGYGERTGNANLTTIIPTVELKLGMPCIGEGKLVGLRSASLYVDELVNLNPNLRAPYVGDASFSHKAGAHVAGVQRNPKTFEHIDPTLVGNERRILVSELSGGSNVLYRMKQMGVGGSEDVSKDDVKAVLAEIKAKENQGYTFESSDASFKMLAQKILNKHKAFFELEGFRVIVEKNGMQQPCNSEATIKVKVNGEIEHTAGEGEGPVEALDVALRKALSRFYPEIADVVLKDYRVRILNPEDATKAVTRVLIESSDGNSRWGTVGVSPNIIEASWQALVDSVEFKMFEDETKNNVE